LKESDTDVSPDRLLEEGLTLYGLGKVGEAVDIWKRVLEISPEHPLALEYIDIAGEDLNVPPLASQAVAPLSGGVSQNAGETYANDLRKGISLMKEERFEDAQSAFLSAAAKKRDEPSVHGYNLLAGAHRVGKYIGVIGDLGAVPKLAQSLDSIKTMNISKEAGFILSFVDGIIPYEDILALARMDRLDAMGHLAQLIEKGAIRSL
jgi:tetratricopeptide (TPR) repeat protein